MNKLQINLDSTALSKSDCILSLWRTVVGEVSPETNQSLGGYKEKLMSPSMSYGIAVHKFIDTMYRTGGHFGKAREKAKEIFLRIPTTPAGKGKDYLKDAEHMLGTCFQVWTDYVSLDEKFEVIMIDGKPLTEITFKIKFWEDERIIVNLCGTIDKIGKFKGGCYALGDWKTTSSWDKEGYFKYYELTRQLRVYRLALSMMAQENPDSILGKIGATNVGSFIDAIFLKPKVCDITFGRSTVFQYGDEEMSLFTKMLIGVCKELSLASEQIKIEALPKMGIIHDTCERKYGKCLYWNVCARPDNVGQLLLKRDFVQSDFNPLNYNSDI